MTTEEQLAADREELERLKKKRFLISRRIANLRRILGIPAESEYPNHLCKRCGREWVGRITHRLPTSCPRCHSALWNEEPVHNRTYKPGRKPTDPPNPNWATNWGKRDKKQSQPSTRTLPPPPRIAPALPKQLSLSEQLAVRIVESPQPERSSRPREEENEPVRTVEREAPLPD